VKNSILNPVSIPYFVPIRFECWTPKFF